MADEDLSHNYQRHHHHHHHRNNQDDDGMVNIFDELKKRKSILLTLFDAKNENNELLNVATQAPAPSKDYCQLVLTYRQVIYRCWRIALRGDSESRYPREVRDNYEDFAYDENTQRNYHSLIPSYGFYYNFFEFWIFTGEIGHVFGKPTLVYVRNIVEKGKLDYLARLPTNLLIKIISFLNLEDIARLSQVNSQFRQVKTKHKLLNWCFFLYFCCFYNLIFLIKMLISFAEVILSGWNCIRLTTLMRSRVI